MMIITGVEATHVLAALFKASSPAAFFNGSVCQPPGIKSDEDLISKCEKHLAANSYVDCFMGRRIKVDFRDFPSLDNKHYDRYYGDGAFAAAIQSIHIEEVDASEGKRDEEAIGCIVN
jgi:hypothetical protein